MNFGPYEKTNIFHIEKSNTYKKIHNGVRMAEFLLLPPERNEILIIEAKTSAPNPHSPGGMFNRKRIQEIDILHVPSLRRNPMISDVFHGLKFMERRGSGLKKIVKEYDDKELPVFYSDQQFFVVTLKNQNYVNPASAQKTVYKTTQKLMNK